MRHKIRFLLPVLLLMLAGVLLYLTITPSEKEESADPPAAHAIPPTPVNNPPQANAQQITTAEETPVTHRFDVLDVDSVKLDIEIVEPPAQGRVELLEKNRFRYTPKPDFFGSDRFRYRAGDGGAFSEPQDVTITVTPVNDPPKALFGSLVCDEDSPCFGRAAAVDPDDTDLSFFIAKHPAHGTAAIDKNGTLTYRPAPGFHGSDRVSFTVKDREFTSPPAAITLTVRSNGDDAVAAVGRIAGGAVNLYDYETLDGERPKPLATTVTEKGKTLNQTGGITLPYGSIEPHRLYILTVEGGENHDFDSDGQRDAVPTPNRGRFHLLATGEAILKEKVQITILSELIYRRLATRLKAGYDALNITGTLESLASTYLNGDIDGDGRIGYSDILAFDYRIHKPLLQQPWEYFQSRIDRLHAHAGLQPQSSTPCGTDPSGTLIYDVVVHDRYAFIAGGADGLLIVPKENPHAAPLARFDTDGYTRAVVLLDATLYLADGSAGVRIVDIRDPAHPKEEAVVDTEWYALDLKLRFPFLYVADGTAGLVVIDVRDPEKPEITARMDTPGYAFGLATAGEYAYIADGPAGLLVVDIANPAAPVIAAQIDTPGYAFDVAVEGEHAYIADGSAGVMVVDIRDPLRPKPVATLKTAGTTFAVEKDKNLLYTAEYGKGIRIIDVSNPKAPMETASYPELCGVFNVRIFEGYLYACDDFAGLIRLKTVRNLIP
jgi:hypothetical protein